MDLFTIIAVVIAVTSGVAGYVQARKAQKGSSEGILLTRADNNAGLHIIYGERRVGGIKVFKDVNNQAVIPAGGRTVIGLNKDATDATRDHWSSNRIWLDRVDVIGQGPIHSVTDIEIDGDQYTHRRFAEKSLSHYRGIVMKGDSSQGYLSELGAKYSRWKSTSIGNDVAYVQSRFRNHQDAVTYQGEPDVQYQVKGRLVWDPRKDINYGGTGSHDLATPSTWEWSDNPALALLDYLLADYGRGLDITDIDVPSFVTAANSCDTLVDVPAVLTNTTGSSVFRYNRTTGLTDEVLNGEDLTGYRTYQVGTQQKRLTCNIVLDPKDSVLDNVKKLLESMKGNLPYHQGKYSLKLEDAASSVMSFGVEDIIGGISFGDGDQNERFNRVTVKFPNRNKRYVMDQVSWPKLDDAQYATYLSEDNNKELWHEVELDGITDFYQAEDVAEFIVRNSRASMRAELRTKSKGIMLQPGDVIDITHPTPGWTNKKFRVRGVKVDQKFEVVLSLGEYQDSVYTWSTKANEPDSPDVGIASPFDELPAITGLSGSVTRVDSARGVPQGLVTLTWDPVEDFEVKEYTLRYKQQSETVFSTTVYPEVTRPQGENPSISFTAPSDDTIYDIYIHYTVTSSGKFSDVATTTVTIPEYRTDLDVEWHDLEIEGPGTEAITDENGDILKRGDLSGMAVYLRNAELTLQGNIDTNKNQLDSDIASLQTLVQDITAGTADVYVQTTAPVAGVGGVPNPIVTNSRWYDSDDNNKPYVWDGSQWVALDDPRIGVNESDIAALQASITDPSTGLTANANAISALDTTVTNLDGVVTANSADITNLETAINDPSTGLSALSTAQSNLQTQVTTNGNAITTNATDITNLQASLGTTNTNVSGNASAISALDARVTTNEAGLAAVGAVDLTELTADLSFRRDVMGEDDIVLDTEAGDDLELENDLSSIVAGSSEATRALTVRVEQTEDGLVSQAQDIVALNSAITDNAAGIAGNAAATSALTTRVTTAEGAITVNSSDITSLESALTTTDGNVTANASAISSLDTRVTSAEGTITSQASSITQLGVDLSAAETTAANASSANATAISGLDVRVTAAEGSITSQASDITALQSDLATANGNITGNATAIGGLDTRVTAAEGSITSQASDISSLQSSLTTTNTNVSSNATAIGGLNTRVTSAEGSITSQASDISNLQSTVTSNTSGISGNSTAIGGLDTRVTAAEGTLTSQAASITSINSAINDPSTGLAANASATQTLSTTVSANSTGIADLSAEYNVRLDVNGNVAGFGLVNTGTSSEFNIVADKFKIVEANGSGNTPFSVSGGVVTMQNVNIGGNLVVGGSITGDKIINGGVDTDQIAANAVTGLEVSFSSSTTSTAIGNSLSSPYNASGTKRSVTITTAGGPVDLYAAFEFAPSTFYTLQDTAVQLWIWRQTGTVYTLIYSSFAVYVDKQQGLLANIAYVDTPSAGTHSYHFQIGRVPNYTVYGRFPYLRALELKR